MVYTVYKTTNLVTGRIYIGVHKTMNPNDGYLGSGKILRQAITLYGKSAFSKEVLYEFGTIDEAYDMERQLVDKGFVARDDTYNLAEGGSKSIDWIEDRKLALKIRLSGELHPFYGKHHTEASKGKTSATLRNRIEKYGPIVTEEQRKKASENAKGKPHPHITTPEANKKRSEAHLKLEKVQCPHCKQLTNPGNAKRWHFSKCRSLNDSV